MDLSPDRLDADQLLQIAFDAVTTGSPGPPPDLEARLRDRALAGPKPVRHLSWGEPVETRPDSLRAFTRTASELGELLDALAPADWSRTTRIDGATVRDVVEHMVGVERYVLGCIDRRPRLDAPRREDHRPVSRRAAAGLADESNTSVSQIWWSEVLALIAACGELGPDHDVAYHHLAGTLRRMLVVRTFELWTHGDDIRQATDRPLDLLDEARLSMMVDELMRVVPLGLALSGCPQPGCTARITLTGPGGGTFDVALDPDPAPGRFEGPARAPAITLTDEAIDLCRLAANRLDPDRFDVVVEGERGLLGPILVGATAFAAD